jgi:mRNA-degrading endonuclease RelE of RelBE toxin-antitoxin system
VTAREPSVGVLDVPLWLHRSRVCYDRGVLSVGASFLWGAWSVQFQISFAPSAVADLAHFRAADQRVIVGAIRTHLMTDADTESRRRKRLAPNPVAPWELRVGDHRVFYEIEGEATVSVLAIGVKQHNELLIRGKKVDL